MTIIISDILYTPQGFKQNLGVAFDTLIRAVDTPDVLMGLYPNAKIIKTPPHTILYPGFINTHVHLEFSANKTALKYGKFMPWLDSVIENRDELMAECDNEKMKEACEQMLRSGVTTFGAISSFGNELEVCQETPQRVVFFNELIGSNAIYADMLYGDFLQRLEASKSCDPSARISPAIAIHSPYSVHPVLLHRAVTLAKQNHLPLSAHLLESAEERQWLESGEGEFRDFFLKYFKTSTPVTNVDEFIHAFDTYPTHFVHAVHAKSEELAYLAQRGHTLAHCPRSNRYLGCGRLAIETLDIPYSVATDGLSSNDSLNILDELRAGLMLHHQAPLEKLAEEFISSITSVGAKALGINAGEISVGKMADFAVVQLGEKPKQEALALWTILHTKEVLEVYIAGEKYV